MSSSASISTDFYLLALIACGPNPIAEAIKNKIRDLKEGRARKIKPYLTENDPYGGEIGNLPPGLNSFIKSGSTTPEMLAYLWLAIETRHSIVILGSDRNTRISLLNALSAFVPSNEKVVTIEESMYLLKSAGIWNTLALYGPFYNHTSAKEQLRNSMICRPGLIMVDELHGEECRELFHNANRSVSFLATMQFEAGKDNFIKRLMGKPFKVDSKCISAIDLTVSIQKQEGEDSSSGNITEYKWLSKAEIDDGTKVHEADMVQECAVSTKELGNSKVISAYSRMQGITAEKAIEEHKKRSDLIERSFKKCAITENAVLAYGGW